MMVPADRRAQEIKGNRARRRNAGIKRDRKWQCVIVAEINGRPGDERNPKKHIHVCPKNRGIDPVHEVNEIMMIDPVDGNDDEAQDVGKKSRPHACQGSGCWIMRRLQFQDHDRNENRHYAVAERFDPGRFHSCRL